MTQTIQLQCRPICPEFGRLKRRAARPLPSGLRCSERPGVVSNDHAKPNEV